MGGERTVTKEKRRGKREKSKNEESNLLTSYFFTSYFLFLLLLDNQPQKCYIISVPEKEPSIKWRPPLDKAAADLSEKALFAKTRSEAGFIYVLIIALNSL